MSRIHISLLFSFTMLSFTAWGMEFLPDKSICTSKDIKLEELKAGAKKVGAVLWDFHGILGVADYEAKTRLAEATFKSLGMASLDELRKKYPKDADDTQKIILKGFIEIQQKPLKENEALKKDYDNIPKGALGEMYGAVFRKHGYTDIAELADLLSTTYKPRPGMDAVVLALANAGIEQYLGSNIAPHVFALVKNRFEKEHKNYMLSMFSIGAMVDLSNYGPVPESDICTTKLVRQPKPSAEFFRTYRSCAATKDVVTVFIDDKKRNIDAAIEHGPMVGIEMNNKDPEFVKTLVTKFVALGIYINP